MKKLTIRDINTLKRASEILIKASNRDIHCVEDPYMLRLSDNLDNLVRLLEKREK